MKRKLVAYTRDAALIRGLQELATAEVEIAIVEDLAAFTDELMRNAAATALLDCAALDAPVEGTVDALMLEFPELRLLVAGQGSEQQALATRISSQAVFRFVHKPASPQRLKLFLDAAWRLPHTPAAPPAPVAAATPRAAGAAAAPGGAGLPPPKLLMMGGGALVAIVVATWLFWPKGESTAPAPTAATAATPAQAEVAKLLQQAEAALAAGRAVASDGSSAAELYREALKRDANNEAARAGFDRSIDRGLQTAEQALLAGRIDEASGAAETLRLIVPEHSRLAFLNAQIGREQARINADASQRQALEARQAQIRAALTLMNTSLQRGALVEPATSSAVARFREAEAINAADPAVRSARETLVAALLTAADNDLSARRINNARRLVDAAGTVHSSAPGLDVLRRRVEEVTAQLAAPPPAAPAPAPVVAEAAPPPARSEPPPAAEPAPAARAENAIVSASTLRQLRSVPPDYPQRALEELVSGWVDLEFTVARDGTVQDVIVTASQPARTFDQAAIAAMRRYRYAPVIRNGEPVPQRARLRMRFTAQDSR